jgi:hypothetical protein
MASTAQRALVNRLDPDAARIQSALRRLLRAALLLAAVTIIGTLGYMLLVEEWGASVRLNLSLFSFRECHTLEAEFPKTLHNGRSTSQNAVRAKFVGTCLVLASVKQERRSGLHQKVRSSGSRPHHCRATTPRMPSSIHPRQRALAPIPIPSLRRGILECPC